MVTKQQLTFKGFPSVEASAVPRLGRINGSTVGERAVSQALARMVCTRLEASRRRGASSA